MGNNSLQELQVSEIIHADLLYSVFIGLQVKNTQQGLLFGFRVITVTECTTWYSTVCILTLDSMYESLFHKT